MRHKKSKGLSKLIKFKIHPDIYQFLKDTAERREVSLAEICRRIIYESVFKVSFPDKKKRKKILKEIS